MKYLFFLLALAALPARADLTYTLEDVTFSDGGTLTGSFTFLDSGAWDWSISAQGGSVLPDFTYNPSTSYVPGSQYPAANDGTLWLWQQVPGYLPNTTVAGQRVLILSLPDATPSPKEGPATIPLALGAAYSFECISCNIYRLVTGGEIEVTGSYANLPSRSIPPIGVPEPAGFLWLTPFALFAWKHLRA